MFVVMAIYVLKAMFEKEIFKLFFSGWGCVYSQRDFRIICRQEFRYLLDVLFVGL